MSVTTKPSSADCPRCGNSFTTGDGYHMIDLIDRPPEPDLSHGNVWDLHFVICRECCLSLLGWLCADASTWDDLAEHLEAAKEGPSEG